MVVGLMMGTLLGFSALAVDIGMIRVAKTQLQVALDAATLSGASEFNGVSSGVLSAKARARQVAALNPVLATTLDIPVANFEVGTQEDDGTFTLWDGVDAKVVNAIRVDHTPPQIGSALGRVAFGIASYTVQARSMAVRDYAGGVATSTECFLPLAVPDCWVANTPVGTNPPPFKFTFQPDPSDSIGWGSPTGNPSASYVRDQLEGSCDNSEPIEVGDPIYVANGADVTALHAIRDILNNTGAVAPSTWDSDLYGAKPPQDDGEHTANNPFPDSDVKPPGWTAGNTIEGPIALIDAGTNCADVSFVQNAR
jgi:hypothetical protein